MASEGMRSVQEKHRMTVKDRASAEIVGVTDVISFDEETVVLETVCGRLTVEGASLHVHTLDVEAGLVALDGRIDAFGYENETTQGDKPRRGWFGRWLG